MTDHCDSNTAQYERNGSFGHLVHALGRPAGGATLPSTGLGLNASKAVSRLDEAGGDTSREFRESRGSIRCDRPSNRRDYQAGGYTSPVVEAHRRRSAISARWTNSSGATALVDAD